MSSQEMLLKVKIKPKGEASRQVVAMSANQYSGVSTPLKSMVTFKLTKFQYCPEMVRSSIMVSGQVESFASI